MKRVILLAAVACGGGSKAPNKPVNPNAPGVVWETTAEPWHVLHPGSQTIIDGDRATFGTAGGWVHQVDLATGKTIRAIKLTMGSVMGLVDLKDGRILVVGFSNGDLYAPPAAFTLDASFTPKSIVLPVRAGGRPALVFPSAVRMADNGVVISGAGLPLSVYDPKDFSVRATLDPRVDWGKLAAHGDVLVAERNYTFRRFDLSTNGQRELGYVIASYIVSADGAEIMRVTRNEKRIIELYREDKTVTQLTADEVDSVHAYDGKRFISTVKGELRIHELPSGEIKKRITVGDVSLASLKVEGNRAVAIAGGVVRVIDLATGAVTPKAPGVRQAAWLAVANDGSILTANDPEVWSVANGKVSATEQLGKEWSIETFRTDDARHFVTAKRTDDKIASFQIHTFGDKAVRTIEPGIAIENAYLGRSGAVLLTSDLEGKKQVWRVPGGSKDKPAPLFAFNADADVIAVDADSDILIAVDGRVAVASQEGTLISTLRIPHCHRIYQSASIDPDSARAVTYDNQDLALWDRKTGKQLAGIKIGGSFDDLVFIPKRDELVITFDDRLVLWSPGKGTRTLRWPGILEPAVSPDGKKLAVSFFDGRIGVYELDVLLAKPLEADFPAAEAIPAQCGDDDPLAVARPPEPEPDEDDPPPPEDEDE